MRERYFRSEILIRLQRLCWVLFVLVFGAATALYLLDHPAARIAAHGGIIAVLLIVAVLTVTMAELFRVARLYRYWLLSYMLLLILLSTILLKTYFSG